MFNEIKEYLNDLHLYVGKEGELKSKLKAKVTPILEDAFGQLDIATPLDSDNIMNFVDLLPLFYDKVFSRIANTGWYQEQSKQTDYIILGNVLALVLYTLETDDNDNIPFSILVDAALKSRESFSDYIILHEIATLVWYDKKFSPELIFDSLNQYEISSSHLYHILSEMSISYPKSTAKYVKNHVNNELVEKIRLKMIKDRDRSKPMAKEIKPKLSKEQVDSIFSKT